SQSPSPIACTTRRGTRNCVASAAARLTARPAEDEKSVATMTTFGSAVIRHPSEFDLDRVRTRGLAYNPATPRNRHRSWRGTGFAAGLAAARRRCREHTHLPSPAHPDQPGLS